jgi:predicted metal-dependent enzyme (double-stranded beta helix superfamily)
MTPKASYSLDQFTADIRKAFDDNKGVPGRPDAVATLMQQLLANGGWIQERLDAGGYGALSGSVYVDAEVGDPRPGFHITCRAATPGFYRPPHDHGAGWVVYGVYEGAIEQTRYAWDYAAGPLSPKLIPKGKFLQKVGEVAYFLPGEVHSTLNVAQGPSVVLRVESQKMAEVQRHSYDLAQNAAFLMGVSDS